jgi:hypothetical protein
MKNSELAISPAPLNTGYASIWINTACDIRSDSDGENWSSPEKPAAILTTRIRDDDRPHFQ